MNKTMLPLLFSCLLVLPLFAQKLTFEGFLGGHYDMIPAASESVEQESETLRFISDSLAVRGYISQRFTLNERYTTRPGYQLGTRTVWHLDQRTALLTGFTVAFRKFTRTADIPTVTTLSTRTTTDTIVWKLGGGGIGGGIPIVYDNRYSDLNINENPPYTLFQLSIPLELRYAITPWLRTKVGVYLAMPIHSKRNIEDARLYTYQKDGVLHYRYEKVEYDDVYGTGLSRLVDGLSGAVELPLTQRLHLEAGVQKDMRSIMQAPRNPVYSQATDEVGYKARPLSIYLRVGYRLL